MVCMALPTNVREAVLNKLEESQARPIELLDRLAGREFTDSELQRAIADLLQEGRIELTSTRILRVKSESAA